MPEPTAAQETVESGARFDRARPHAAGHNLLSGHPYVSIQYTHPHQASRGASVNTDRFLWYSCVPTVGVHAKRTGAKVRDEKRTAQHRNVLKEHCLLHLGHHRILDCPEVMHHHGDGNQESHQ